MNNHIDDIQFSLLADGELQNDEQNELLLKTLDDTDARERLKSHLQFRQAMGAWRKQESPRPVLAISENPHHPAKSAMWRIGEMAVAAMLGGIFVLAGIWGFAGFSGQSSKEHIASNPKPLMVTQEQQRQVANVFALHESVAGPLKWYAASDRNIQLASEENTASDRKPVAVMLRLAPEKVYTIVCRDQEPAIIEFPKEGKTGTVRLRLVPKVKNGKVDIRYAIAMDSIDTSEAPAVLSGRRRVGIKQTSLGQLALADDLLDIDASAWVIDNNQN